MVKSVEGEIGVGVVCGLWQVKVEVMEDVLFLEFHVPLFHCDFFLPGLLRDIEGQDPRDQHVLVLRGCTLHDLLELLHPLFPEELFRFKDLGFSFILWLVLLL